MTISTFIRLTATLTASFVLCATAALAQGPGIDDGSHWEPMFKATGTIAPGGVVELMGGQPPVLGQTSHLNLTAPGFDFGFVAVSATVSTGFPIHIGSSVVDLYFDPFGVLGTFALPMPGGQAQMPLALPPNPALSGFELGFQGLVLDPVGNVAASNLLIGNFGLFAGGQAFFAFQFGGNNGVSVPRNNYWPTTARKNAIVWNATAAAKDYTICGTRQASNGVLEIRDQNGNVLATFPGNQTVITVTLTVPAGSKLFFFNSGTATINTLKWTIKVG